MKQLIFKTLDSFGYELRKKVAPELKPKPLLDQTEPFMSISNFAGEFTMTNMDRLQGLFIAVNYVVDNNIEGDFVECGVWRGGSSMAAALTFINRKQTDRKIWMYDTYEGMAETTEHDRDKNGFLASEILKRSDKSNPRSYFCIASYEEVEANMKSTRYPMKNIQFIKGNVEETLLKEIPDKISILRLDTDYYTSTKAELEILYDKLVPGGVLILDDYGHWQGARKAVDDYFDIKGKKPLFSFLDYAGVIAIKPL